MDNRGGGEEHVDLIKADLSRVVRDHVWFYAGQPEQVAEIASRMGTTPEAVLVYMIVEQILEEYHLTPRK